MGTVHLYTNPDGFKAFLSGNQFKAWTKGLSRSEDFHIEVPLSAISDFRESNNKMAQEIKGHYVSIMRRENW